MWLFNFIGARWGASAAWRAITLIVPIAAAVLAALAAGAIAWQLGRAPLQVELAQLKTSMATSAKQQADAQAASMSQAQAQTDVLALALGQATVKNQALTSEISHALQTATSGRACLHARALSLLNSAPGIRIAAPTAPMPSPGAAALAEGAAAATHSVTTFEPNAALTDAAQPQAVITDTALAQWVAQAGGLYETCRLRLDALVDWHAPSFQK